MIGLVVASDDGEVVVMFLPRIPLDGTIMMGYSVGEMEFPVVPIRVDDLAKMLESLGYNVKKA